VRAVVVTLTETYVAPLAVTREVTPSQSKLTPLRAERGGRGPDVSGQVVGAPQTEAPLMHAAHSSSRPSHLIHPWCAHGLKNTQVGSAVMAGGGDDGEALSMEPIVCGRCMAKQLQFCNAMQV
jgi:hypothetical protein